MRVMISGGGTGGHIYPALALIERLKQRGLLDAVLYVGTERGLESKIVPDQGIDFKTLEIQGFKRSMNLNGIKTNLKTIELFMSSIKSAKKMIKEFKPDVVIGTGGYVSGSLLYAASRLKVPTIIHEQNSAAGVTNKFLARFVDKVAISFESVSDQFPMHKVILTGNPRAQQVAGMVPNERLSEFGLKTDSPTVMIFGGSRGAPSINKAFIDAVPLLNERDYQVLFVSGQVHYENVQAALANTTLNSNLAFVPYISNMPEVLPDLKAIVGRAGATSLAEITALGIPSILIPSPYVTNDHQTKNAQSLVKEDAAILIPEPELTGASLVKALDTLFETPEKQHAMAKAAKKSGIPDASDRIIEVIETII